MIAPHDVAVRCRFSPQLMSAKFIVVILRAVRDDIFNFFSGPKTKVFSKLFSYDLTMYLCGSCGSSLNILI